MTGAEVLGRERDAVEGALARVLPPEGAWPERLTGAMRYAVLGGGKRLRPSLARLSCRAAGGDAERITEAACGLELIHTYSLVHDDLPALDDDRLRRGRETVHVVWDEATAILVGDALLTEGLRLLASRPEGEGWSARRAEAVAVVAAAAGASGMVGGQMEDLEATGAPDPVLAPERLERIHRHKTGALIAASVEIGALLAGEDSAGRGRWRGFGERLGLAFQIADDVLDHTSTAAELGKSPGKDDAAGKLTYVSCYGLDGARQRLRRLEEELVVEAETFAGAELAEVARFVVTRRR